jgi:predicted phage-related endonuclease
MNMEAPTLEKSAEWHAERAKGIGGSDAKRVMEGDWYALWMEKTGRAEPEDLSNVLAVQMGSWTEPLNVHWFGKVTGKHVAIGVEPVVSPDHAWMRANLDGWCEADWAVFEAKHVSAWDKADNVVSRYYPQLQHCIAVTNADRAFLSVFYGNNKHEWYEVERDDVYIAELVEREQAFWAHVQDDIQPENPNAVQASISLDDMREVEMTGDNAWADLAATWLETRDAAKRFRDADKGIKHHVPEDARLAYGHGIQVKRASNGSLTIKEHKR